MLSFIDWLISLHFLLGSTQPKVFSLDLRSLLLSPISCQILISLSGYDLFRRSLMYLLEHYIHLLLIFDTVV